MTYLKPHTAFPSMTPQGYEIVRSNEDNIGSYRSPADQPTRGGNWTTYKTKDKAQAACDRLNVLNGACIVINVRRHILTELVECERDSYEDGYTHGGFEISERPLESHVHVVAMRSTSRLIIRTREEAEDAYYAVCSGTFSTHSRACYNAAVRIADALRPYATPETVKAWPRPPKL
jgi:hypothetical protein